MNEFIVWDKVNKEFGRISEAGTISEWSWDECTSNNDYTLHQYIGKTDINGNKIYADSSIVEFNILDSKYRGFFTYNSARLRYEIEISSKESIIYDGGVKDFKIIDTIQENKLGLIKCNSK